MVIRTGVLLWIIGSFVAGFLIGASDKKSEYQTEIQALHIQIEKQNCEEMTWPKLKRSVE